jgi:hypothetical protein
MSAEQCRACARHSGLAVAELSRCATGLTWTCCHPLRGRPFTLGCCARQMRFTDCSDSGVYLSLVPTCQRAVCCKHVQGTRLITSPEVPSCSTVPWRVWHVHRRWCGIGAHSDLETHQLRPPHLWACNKKPFGADSALASAVLHAILPPMPGRPYSTRGHQNEVPRCKTAMCGIELASMFCSNR